MATINNNSIQVGTADYDNLQASVKMRVEVLDDSIVDFLNSLDIINMETRLEAESGSQVVMYNTPRLNALGFTGDKDAYANAIGLQTNTRKMQINKHSMSVAYSLKGTMRQQIVSFNLSAEVPRQHKQWGVGLINYQIMNQLTSNTALTKLAPEVVGGNITAADQLLILEGHNSAVAPTSLYKAIGSLGAGGITLDQNVVSSNPLTLRDFQQARQVINNAASDVPLWNKLKKRVNGKEVDALALISTTGMNQLRNDPLTQGQGFNIPQIVYAGMAGGNKQMDLIDVFVVDGIAFKEMPDHWFSRGIDSNTGAPVAGTRRCVLLGEFALDMAMGKGFGGKVAGFSLEVDENYKPLNKQGYSNAEIIGGVKKTQINGTGVNASALYDNAIYTITHYSNT